MTTFALLHGAWHDAWCWGRLIPELERRGHEAIAMDLPGDDSAATFDDYADVVTGVLASHRSDDVVVVGHSLAGMTIPLVAARHRVRALVYLCALLPVPGSSFVDQLATEDMLNLDYVAGLGEPDPNGLRGWTDEGIAREIMYADCDPEVTAQAIARLRPQAQAPYARPCSLEAFPQTSATYVLCAEDQLVKPDWSRSAARERLDADVVELPGSHSPFLSRPADLARVLHDVAVRLS
jgi:pimeloyl-ACP methyl ester carboxylesterase